MIMAVIAAFVGTATGLALMLDHRRWRRERARVRGTFRIARTALGPIPYLDVGPQDGVPVLLATGGGSGIDSVHAFPWLTDAGFRLIAIARPGYHGVPLSTATTLEAHADLYATVLAAIGIDSVHVFGLSAGGPSALYYAARHPTRSLVLWSAVTGRYRPNQSSMDSLLGRMVLSSHGQALISWALSRSARWLPRQTMAAFLRAESHLCAREINDMIDQMLADESSLASFRRLVDSTTPMTDLYPGMIDELRKMGESWSAPWHRIRVPVLAVASDVDKDVSPDHLDRVEQEIPRGRILRVKAGGHFVWWGRDGRRVINATLEHLQSDG